MHLSPISFFLAVTSCLAANTAVACSCASTFDFIADGELLARAYHNATFVVHLRVNKVVSEEVAEVEVIEDFKNGSLLKEIIRSTRPSSACGRGPFKAGEEGIFFVQQSRTVGLCSNRGHDKDFVERLRRLRP